MAEADAEPTPESNPEPSVAASRRPWWLTALRWLVGVLVLVLLLLVGTYFGLDTQLGHRFLVSQIGGYTTESGLNIRVGRIDGSIYNKLKLTNVEVRDPKGVFVTIPTAELDWHPFSFLNNHVDVVSMTGPLVTLLRSPELKAADPNAPLLPDIDVDIGRLKVDRVVLERAVTGDRHIIRLDGGAHIAGKRAQLTVIALAVVAPGIKGGDRLNLKLDAEPDKNRLDIQATLDAPANGVVASMSNLAQPLQIRIGGKGDWKNWRGKGLAKLGGQSLADLDLTAQSGRFTVSGLTHPGLYVAGPVERLTAPGLQVDASAYLDQRRADTKFTLRSDALAVTGNGLLDFARSSFGAFTIDAQLLTPGAILPNLSGKDVAAHILLDGPFATPTVNYSLSAAALAFGATGVEGVSATGVAKIDAEHILIPVNARARRVTGLNAAAGGLLANVAINGDIAYSNGKLLSDNLKLRSDKIDATAIVVADLPNGKYTGALKGRVNDYTIDGVGIVNLTTDAKLVSMAGGGFGITGHVVAQTSKIFNEGLRTFLGGNAILRTDVGYDPDGIITFNNLNVAAPQFTVTRGSGRYDPNGPILFSADAYSKAYGPLTARVDGTIAAPVVRLHAARPGLGVGLANLDAVVRGTGQAYAVLATGGTNYGPFKADLLVRTAPALTVDIHQGTVFAGIGLNGSVRATPAGPFAGRVNFAGSGVSGAALLNAAGKYQKVDVAATASNARIPGGQITVGRAIVNASVVLYPNAPRVVADAQVAALSYGTTVIQTARAKIDYQNGSGTAQAVATGSSGVPFTVALNARMSPRLWLAALQGKANGVTFKTAGPARIIPGKGGYTLQPVRVDFDQGSARLAGTYGRGMTAQVRLDRADLSIIDVFVPNLGLGGSATGGLDYTQAYGASVPKIEASGQISNFTRSSLVSASEPVDVQFAALLNDAGGNLRALIKRGPNAVGRALVTLSPLGGGPAWTARLLAAPLGGGIRYNGPSAVLFSLAGLSGQQLSGGIAVAADFSGRLAAPQLNGIVRGDALTYENELYGTKLTNMQLAGRFTADRLEITTLNARAGKGTVQARGTIGLAAASGFPIDLEAQLDNAQLAKSDALGATATGRVRLTNGPGGGLIKGDIVIPEARYQVVFQGASEVQELTGVRRKSDLAGATGAAPQAAALPSPGAFKLDVNVRAQNQLYVSGMGLDSEWSMDLHVGGTSGAPVIGGNLDIVRGTYTFAGKRFDISRGVVRFAGNGLLDPDLDIEATTSTNGITAIIDIGGTGQNPQVAFTSSPVLPQDEVLSRLLFGSDPSNLSATEAIQLAAALSSLRPGSGGGLNPLGKLRSATGFDRLRILGADEATGRSTALAAGKYITKNVYVEIITDARGFTATQLEVALSKVLRLLSATGSFGGTNASLRYQRNF